MPKGIYDRTKAKSNKGYFKKGQKSKNWNGFKKGDTTHTKSLKNWQGGRIKRNGYICIKKPKHPFSNSQGYIREHRFIIEKFIGRFLQPEEASHHLGKKTDNRPHLLMAFANNPAHMRFHKNPDSVKPAEIIFDGRKL